MFASRVLCVYVRVFNHGRGVILIYWSPAAWCLRNEGVSSVLLGASNTDQLMENIGAIQVSVFVCVRFACVTAKQIRSLICENATWPALLGSYSCLTVHSGSLLSWARLGLLGSLLLHAWVLYCTELIRSEEYQLPVGLEMSSQPLPPLLIRCTL